MSFLGGPRAVSQFRPAVTGRGKVAHLREGERPVLGRIDLMKSGAEAFSPAKEQVRRLLDRLPDDASLEDIQYHIYVREKIERGLNDVEAGRVLSEKQFDARMARWLEP